jgi:hypothetical protein
MIISASRRTDMPAFYSEWFMNRLREGYCLVLNPFNPWQVARISLVPESVDAIVFWSKNAASSHLKSELLVLDDLRQGIPTFLYDVVFALLHELWDRVFLQNAFRIIAFGYLDLVAIAVGRVVVQKRHHVDDSLIIKHLNLVVLAFALQRDFLKKVHAPLLSPQDGVLAGPRA